MVQRTVVGSIATRSRALPPPASQMVAQRVSYIRNSIAFAAIGVGGGAIAGIVHHPDMSTGVTAAGVAVSAVTLAEGRLRHLRHAQRDRLVEALAPLLSPRTLLLDRRMVSPRWWSPGWPGTPRRITVNYAPGAGAADPKWLPEVLTLVEQRLGQEYRVRNHDTRRCRLILSRRDPRADDQDSRMSPLRERAERTIVELIGPTARVVDVRTDGEDLVRITVQHEAGTRLASSGYRARIERTISTVLPGRWRARWNLERDQVVFEVRPSFPDTVWMQPMPVDPAADILSTYDKVAIPFAVDEDGQEQLWRPAIDPNLLVVGAPGTGKALALNTPIPTPHGFTPIGDLRAGDTIYDEQGHECSVLTAHSIRDDRPCYRVTFSDGSSVIADAEHLWQTSTKAERAAQRRRVPRPQPRLNEASMSRLIAELDRTSPGDVISIPEMAHLIGTHPTSRTLFDLLGALPVITRRRPTEVWRTHEPLSTTHTQRVNVFDRREALAAASAPRWLAKTGMPPAELHAMALQEAVGSTITSVELRTILGGWTVDQMTSFMRAHPGLTKRSTVVETPRQMGRRVRPYRPATRMFNKQAALAKIIAWGRTAQPRRLPESATRTTEQIRESLRDNAGASNHSVPLSKPLLGRTTTLPIDPYVLGVWLGDGTSEAPVITSADLEVADLMRDCGVDVVEYGHGRPSPGGLVHTFAVRGIRTPLKQLKLMTGRGQSSDCGKHIPAPYRRASAAQRLDLLQGLMDTDGTVSPQGGVQYTSTRRQLAEDVHELACTLGFRATIQEGRARLNGRDCGPKWTISWTTDQTVFRLSRKRDAQERRTTRFSAGRNNCRYIVAVDPVESVPVRCITVDSPNSLYLVGRTFIPTHNTSTEHCILAGVAIYNWPIWIVDGKGIEFLGFRSWPNVQVVATLVEEQVAVLERAWEVMEHRYQLIVNGQARKSDFEPLMVFLDEFADFRSNLLDWYATVKQKGDPTVPPVLAKIASIARKGRSSRVHLLFATQRPDASYFGAGGVGGGDMRDNFRARISMGRLSPQGAIMMWQDPSVGVSLPRGKRGRATTINDDNHPVEIQGYRCPDPADPDLPTEQRDILARLRPAESVHDRLLVKVPQTWIHPETGVEVEPTYREYARAAWVRASEHPELDPEANEAMGTTEARVLASPMTIFGLSGVTMPSAQKSGSPAWREPHAAADDGAQLGSNADPGVDEDDLNYGPPVDVRPEADEIAVGDLLLVDPEAGHWAVVDEPPGDDPADPSCWAIPWRDDADDSGLLSVPDGERVTVRRAKENPYA